MPTVWARLATLALVTVAGVSTLALAPSARPPSHADIASVPLLAYYYIWFDPSSWDRGKTDQPLLGRYSSDDEAVMRQHVRWAKAAGIEGFIVSWKSTAVLDKRLESLMRIAAEEDFRLAIIYQGLDFKREPLGIELIAEDLDRFIAEYAADPVFRIWEKPLVIWSGTWEFTEAEIEDVAEPRRDRLLILGSERSLDGVARIAPLLDGNAYYWSSVNPATNSRHETKLREMGRAVHDAGGRWIAPAAPGFDARRIGGASVVPRAEGRTLAAELDAAVRSLPDAVGLISWNEFSENTHVEPSRAHGDRYIGLLADWRNRPPLDVADFDSSAPEGTDGATVGRFLALLFAMGLAGLGLAGAARRGMAAAR
jgi:hypothetical protein